MKHYSFLFVLLISYFSPITAQFNIGHYQITFQDPNRSNRNIQTEIYYPATSNGNNVPAANGQFPVIVFGHGFVMAWDAYQNIWEELVPEGYIMAFPRTEGNAFSTDHQQFGWDLQFLVNQIQSEGFDPTSPIYNVVHPNTGLMGHSMGGGAAFLAADSLCNNGSSQLKTLVGLAPAESTSNGVSSIASASEITVPSLIFSGSQDGVTPPSDHHFPMYNGLNSTCKTILSITGGGHCYFANTNFNCDFGESTSSSGIAISRTEQQQTTYHFLLNWLDYTLKNDCEAFHQFQDSVTQSDRISATQSCSSNPISSIIENGGILSSSISGTSYQWFLNSVAINGANAINYTPTSTGIYTVEVSFVDGCPTISDPYSFSIGTSSVYQPILEHLQPFPNPTSRQVSFYPYTVEDGQLFDLSGKLLKRFAMTQTVDLSDLGPGIYLLSLDGKMYKIEKN